MLYLCPNYSALQWQMLEVVLTEHCKNFDPEMGNIVITYKNIIFNSEIQALPHSFPSKNTRKMVQVLIHEVRRDIYARRTAHPPQTATPVPELLGMKSCEMVDKLQALNVIWSAGERGKSLLVLECP